MFRGAEFGNAFGGQGSFFFALIAIIIHYGFCQVFLFTGRGTPHRGGMFEVGPRFSAGHVDMAQDAHRDYPVSIGEANAAHTGRIPTGKDAHIGHLEADTLAKRRSQHDVLILRTHADPDNTVALIKLHGDLAVAIDADKVRQLVATHRARAGGEHDVQLCAAFFVIRQRHDAFDAFILGQREDIDQRLAARLRPANR